MRVKNNTGAVLERGPILVLDEGTYVGEAILPYTTVESENHIAYAVDLGVTLKEEYKSGSELQVISISNKYFQKEYLEWKECEYEVQNKKKDEIDLVIEHPKSDYKVDEKVTQKPTEETDNYYRWKFKVKPKSSSKFKVRETIIRYYSESIRNLSLTTIKSYFNNNYISKRDYGDVKEIIDLQQEINKLNNENNKMEGERSKIYNEQSRLRSNLESLGSSNREEKLRIKYVDKLDAQEKRLEDIDENIKDNKKKIEKLDKEIEKKLGSLK
jgi:predicted RNase H-like nuclease (RuvC/YqgF family)